MSNEQTNPCRCERSTCACNKARATACTCGTACACQSQCRCGESCGCSARRD